MKKNIARFLPLITIIGLTLGFSSCKEDEPPATPKLSFAESTMAVTEDDAGVIKVELVLDRAYSRDLTISYTLGGTASDQDAVGTAAADYEVVGDHGEVIIESGETSGFIELEIYADGGFEADETIEISITDVDSDDVEITGDDEIEITITNDDEQVEVSFASSTLTVNEADGGQAFVEVTVNLDQPAPAGGLTLNYSLEGTALDSTFAFNQVPKIPPSYYDYYINGVAGELVIEGGATSGVIEIGIYTDFRFENDETIIITLTGPSSGAQIGANNTMTVTVEQQNGKVIALVWDEAYTDVDMDMFLWFGMDLANLENILATATTPSVDDPKQELIFFPSTLMSNEEFAALSFGLSYNYYSGTANPMNFEVQFADYVDGVLEAEAVRNVYPATYTLDNINRWDETDVLPLIVQTFKLLEGDFSEISDIEVPNSGSRIKTKKLPKGIRKEAFSVPRPL